MNRSSTTPSDSAPADEDLVEQAHPGHGVPSQDPASAGFGPRRAGKGLDVRGVVMKALVRLTPASELAMKNGVRFPDESREYRIARDSLLGQEIELRRPIERVAEQRRALPAGGEVAAIARSPIQRFAALKRERGRRDLKIFSDGSADYTRDYVSAEDADLPGFSIFSGKSGLIRHFWSGEMGPQAPIPARTRAVCQI